MIYDSPVLVGVEHTTQNLANHMQSNNPTKKKQIVETKGGIIGRVILELLFVRLSMARFWVERRAETIGVNLVSFVRYYVRRHSVNSNNNYFFAINLPTGAEHAVTVATLHQSR